MSAPEIVHRNGCLATGYELAACRCVFWRTSCGSFAVYGMWGAYGDWLCEAAIEVEPTRIVCGDKTYAYFHATFARALLGIRDAISASREKDILQQLHLMRRVLEKQPMHYTGGIPIEMNREMVENDVWMYRGDDVVAVLRGWLP